MVYEELGQQHLQENEFVFIKPKQPYFKGNEVQLDEGGLNVLFYHVQQPQGFFLFLFQNVFTQFPHADDECH